MNQMGIIGRAPLTRNLRKYSLFRKAAVVLAPHDMVQMHMVHMVHTVKMVKPMFSARRGYKVLAIESSCDDSCVALLDRDDKLNQTIVVDQLKSTLDSAGSGGVIPTAAHLHHQENLSKLVSSLCMKHGLSHKSPPDLICVTRGPGMPGSLSIGTELAKGLSIAWNKPLIGVHHMLGHLLIARLQNNGKSPEFPFLSLLVSGGHTLLVLSRNLLQHDILVDTLDIAAGDALDKCAREIGISGNMIGKELEKFLEENRNFLTQEILSKYKDIEFTMPLRNKPGRSNLEKFSFAPFSGQTKKILANKRNENLNMNLNSDLDLNLEFKTILGFKIQDSIFKHLLEKIQLSLKLDNFKEADNKIFTNVKEFVCSGGVGSNLYLRKLLKEGLPAFEKFHFPDPKLCTDNAIMIGWAGIELYEKYGLTSDLSITPLRKWPLTNITDVDGWIKKG
ncbi:hypothetical protein PACTADRAFT_51524 [Pachysolen tannophilus NRRL Y-2460]|uniref:N(6)-L-threonylcarbamoyladenine synthase n=1 Tax=Pachysolen tannophilus NRRL Y-2460 TaxID=669874 RepID=A0A1E4TPU2_PACTA|nr:hypothetical protein PACTADRAFT_51524 [Pachysolen tannophilus NRRL Y-2460]